jgi:hypothetical protein
MGMFCTPSRMGHGVVLTRPSPHDEHEAGAIGAL